MGWVTWVVLEHVEFVEDLRLRGNFVEGSGKLQEAHLEKS